MARLLFSVALLIALLPSLAAEPDKETLVFNSHLFPPYVFFDNEEPAGPVVDAVQEICQRLNISCIVRINSLWNQSQREVKEGNAHGLFVLGRNPEREEWLQFSAPIVNAEYGFFGLASDKRSYEQLKDLAGKHVGVFGPSNTSWTLYQISKQLTASGAKPINVNMWMHTQDLVSKLARGDLDLLFTNKAVGQAWINFLGLNRWIEYKRADKKLRYYIGFSKASVDPTLVIQFNEQWRKMSADGTTEKLFKAYDLKPIL